MKRSNPHIKKRRMFILTRVIRPVKRWIVSKGLGKTRGNDKGYIFVYGTLKVGGYFSPPFNNKRLSTQPATVKGTLYDLGGFPGLSLEGSDVVHGELHLYKDFSLVLRHMDLIEGFSANRGRNNLYARQTFEVKTPNGKQLAELYTINPMVVRRFGKVLKSGAWPIVGDP